MAHPRPLVVVILDGWGISFLERGNAIRTAKTPIMDSFAAYYPSASIQAGSVEVGLPWGEVGNSETGHRNIGAGTIQYQTLPLIDKAIEEGDFFRNEHLLAAITHVKDHKKSLHLLGLVSPGGVHAHINHLLALLELCHRERLKQPVYIHMITDGRDTQPQSALAYLQKLEETMKKTKIGEIASVTGRFYAMDRNKNWDRTEATYNMLTGGPRQTGAPSARVAIEQAYKQDMSDEMIAPTAITRGGSPIGTMQDGDAVIFFNFRPDRARQLAATLADPQQVPFLEGKRPKRLTVVTLSKYDPESSAPSAYVEEPFAQPLAKVLADAGLRQFHIAETEKYAHVTYYLNVGHEEPFAGEERQLIESAKVKNFAEEPRMQAGPITDTVLARMAEGQDDVFFVNYANADMVGHTGDFEAAVEACAWVDECLGRLTKATLEAGGALLVTADHGNAEEMLHPQTGAVETDHTNNPVPLHYVRADLARTTPKSPEEIQRLLENPVGILTDVAPTVLAILELPQPPAMTGISLLTAMR